MASQQKSAFSLFNPRSLVLGLVTVATTVTAVVLSQPRDATASVVAEACDVNDHQVSPEQAFSRGAFTRASNDNAYDTSLFWNSLTKTWLTDEQAHLLNLAYKVGMEDGGIEQAELLQAILLQETIAGHLGRIGHMTAPVGKRSYGIMQVKVTAARDVLRDHKSFGRFRSDEELIAQLLTDDEFNIRVASKFFLLLSKHAKSVDRSLVAYNIGLRGSRKVASPNEFKYVIKAKRNLDHVVKPFNRRYNPVELKVALR
ncbi:hypothetical protein ACFL2V_01395 [Pseudomonadota bacterium]